MVTNNVLKFCAFILNVQKASTINIFQKPMFQRQFLFRKHLFRITKESNKIHINTYNVYRISRNENSISFTFDHSSAPRSSSQTFGSGWAINTKRQLIIRMDVKLLLNSASWISVTDISNNVIAAIGIRYTLFRFIGRWTAVKRGQGRYRRSASVTNRQLKMYNIN